MALFGDLVATMEGKELSGLRTQVYQSMVPLLLHLKDKCPKVAMVSAPPEARQADGLHLGQGLGGQMAAGLPERRGSPGPHTALWTTALPACPHMHTHTGLH